MHADLSGIHASKLCTWAPPLMEVLHYNALNAINMQRNNVWFLPGTATFGGIKQDRETEEGSSHQESNLRSLVWAAQNRDPWFKFLVAASLKWGALALRSSGCPLFIFLLIPSRTNQIRSTHYISITRRSVCDQLISLFALFWSTLDRLTESASQSLGTRLTVAGTPLFSSSYFTLDQLLHCVSIGWFLFWSQHLCKWNVCSYHR